MLTAIFRVVFQAMLEQVEGDLMHLPRGFTWDETEAGYKEEDENTSSAPVSAPSSWGGMFSSNDDVSSVSSDGEKPACRTLAIALLMPWLWWWFRCVVVVVVAAVAAVVATVVATTMTTLAMTTMAMTLMMPMIMPMMPMPTLMTKMLLFFWTAGGYSDDMSSDDGNTSSGSGEYRRGRRKSRSRRSSVRAARKHLQLPLWHATCGISSAAMRLACTWGASCAWWGAIGADLLACWPISSDG